MKILEKFTDWIEQYKVNKLQKMLIKTEDDQKVIDALPSDEENFAYNFPKVIGSMQETENKLEVVNNNIDEIIAENVVRDTLKKLENDKAIKKILIQNKETLEQHNKIKNAIEAIKNNESKLKLTQDYIASLEDCEILTIFDTLKPTKNEMEKQNVESMKIEIISKKIIYHIKIHGYVWHLDGFTYGLNDRAKLSILNNCIKKINLENYNSNKENIHHESKNKFIFDLLRLTEMKDSKKFLILEEFKNKKCISESDVKYIKGKFREERDRKALEINR